MHVAHSVCALYPVFMVPSNMNKLNENKNVVNSGTEMAHWVNFESCRDDAGVSIGPEVSIAPVPVTKSLWNFSIGFKIGIWNKLCDKNQFMILKRLVRHDNLFQDNERLCKNAPTQSVKIQQTPLQFIRTEEASWMRGETSSRNWNKSSCLRYNSYIYHDLDDWEPSST